MDGNSSLFVHSAFHQTTNNQAAKFRSSICMINQHKCAAGAIGRKVAVQIVSLKMIEHKDGTNLQGNFNDFAKPCIITGLTNGWPAKAQNRWSFENLKEFYGNVSFSCWNCLDIDDPIVNMTMNEYIDNYIYDRSLHNEQTMLYLNDKFFERSCPQMTKDYSIPSIFAEYGRFTDTASFAKRVLVGPSSSHTYMHIDNLYTSAWNTVVVGRKYWIMIQPKVRPTPAVGESSEQKPWHDCAEDEVMKKGTIPQMIAHLQETEPDRFFYTFVQHPGDTVFIPAQWFHAVVNIDDTVGVSHAFVQPGHLEQHLRMALSIS